MSYEVEIKPDHIIFLHRSQLKPHFEDEFAHEKLELHHFQLSSDDVEWGLDE